MHRSWVPSTAHQHWKKKKEKKGRKSNIFWRTAPLLLLYAPRSAKTLQSKSSDFKCRAKLWCHFLVVVVVCSLFVLFVCLWALVWFWYRLFTSAQNTWRDHLDRARKAQRERVSRMTSLHYGFIHYLLLAYNLQMSRKDLLRWWGILIVSEWIWSYLAVFRDDGASQRSNN